MVKPPPRRVCWWGKLPARGDFVGRGLPPRWRSDWDGWLRSGLAFAATTLDGPTLDERLRAFPPWRYVACPAPGEAWCGIIVPSQDRVGRAFPLTLAERMDTPASLHESAAGLASLRECGAGLTSLRECAARLASLLVSAADGPDALEAAIAVLPAPPEPRAANPTWPRTGSQLASSLWWPLDAADEAEPLCTDWPPAPSLLLELLAPDAQRVNAKLFGL